MSTVKVPVLKCQRCGKEWIPRSSSAHVCPRCHSPKWREPKG